MACAASGLSSAFRLPSLGTPLQKRSLPVAAASLPLPPRFGFVILTASASTLLLQWQAIQVGLQRRKSGLNYPMMYEDAEVSLFNCYQRAHQNTLESYSQFLTLLLLSGLGYPITASLFGMVWIVGRVFYSLGYYSGEPEQRFKGIWNNFGLLGLLVASIVHGIRLLAAVPST